MTRAPTLFAAGRRAFSNGGEAAGAIHRFWTTLLCATLGVVACRRAPELHLLDPLPRCYRLAVGPWKIPQNAKFPEQRTIHPTPQLLVLEAARSEGLLGIPPDKNSPWRRLRGESEDSAWNNPYPFREWMVEGDSLFALFHTGNGGLSMNFRIVGDSLVGDVGEYEDRAGMEYPRAPAIGVRVSCPRS